MKLELKGEQVRIYRDIGTKSCGECRTEWELVFEVNYKQLLVNLINLKRRKA